MNWQTSINQGYILCDNNDEVVAYAATNGVAEVYLDIYLYSKFDVDAEPLEFGFGSQEEAMEKLLEAMS